MGNERSEGNESGKPTIGFIGLGRMGTPMASRLLDAGWAVVGYDTVDAAMQALIGRGAKGASSPRDVADRSDIVFTSLPVPAVVEKVVLGDDGVIRGSRSRIFVDLSTTGPRMAARIGEAVGSSRVDLQACKLEYSIVSPK